MKLTKSQQEDVEFYLEFCPRNLFHTPTDNEVREFLDYSEQGIQPAKNGMGHSLNPIIIGKSRLGLNIQLWQEGILDGSVPYFTLLGGEMGDKPVSRRLVNYMKTQMFKGIDAELIEKCYQEILQEKSVDN